MNDDIKLKIIKYIERFFWIVPIIFIVCLIFSYLINPKITGPGGFGFGSLQKNLEAWKFYRNVVWYFYIFFAIVGAGLISSIKSRDIKIGRGFFMRLVLGTVLLFFSYAIAGLIIDLSWLVIYAVLTATGQIDLAK